MARCNSTIWRESIIVARKLRTKKNFIGVSYFVRFRPVITITTFIRIWHLRDLVFKKGGSPALDKCSLLLSVIAL